MSILVRCRRRPRRGGESAPANRQNKLSELFLLELDPLFQFGDVPLFALAERPLCRAILQFAFLLGVELFVGCPCRGRRSAELPHLKRERSVTYLTCLQAAHQCACVPVYASAPGSAPAPAIARLRTWREPEVPTRRLERPAAGKRGTDIIIVPLLRRLANSLRSRVRC